MNIRREEVTVYPFRPWVGRAGGSILAVALVVVLVLAGGRLLVSPERRGWLAEPSAWAYAALLILGGAKIYFGARRPVAEIGPQGVKLRPLHTLGSRLISWETMLGTEQTIPGDRLILYYDRGRGLRFVALNLNLVRGRREFLSELDARLRDSGFSERMVGRSRYRSRLATRIEPGEDHE